VRVAVQDSFLFAVDHTLIRIARMALFEVPGWKVPNAPVTSSAPKKRKRPASASVEDGQMQAAAVNVEKLMRSIDSALEKEARAAKKQSKAKETPTDTSALKSPTRQGKEKAKKKRNDAGGSKAKADAPAEPAHRQATPDLMPDGAQPPSKKRKQDKHKGKSQDAPSASAANPPAKPAAKPSSSAGPSGPTKMTAMQTKMKSKLDGARFRSVPSQPSVDCVDPHPMQLDQRRILQIRQRACARVDSGRSQHV
jgi:ribosomal RNA-processing protein 8